MIADAFGALVGADRVRAPNPTEALGCETVIEAASVGEIAEIVRKCESDRITLAPIGGARTLAGIRHTPVDVGLSMARMARVIAYEPDDLTVVAEAGVTLGALNAQMVAHRQRLPLDPPSPPSATLGAIIGASRSGPIRLSEGLVRDLLIGIQFVGHGGRIARAGGRVVKNVAGYDLMKVLAGSFGTLGIVTEAAFKVRPTPELYALALAHYDPIAETFDAAAKLLDALPLSHLEVLSPQPGAAFGARGRFLLLAGFSGNQPEIDYQRATILSILSRAAAPKRVEILEGGGAIEAYERLRDFEFPAGNFTMQIAVLPAELARCLAECDADFRAHAGCGVAQVSIEAAGAEPMRTAVTRWRAVAASARGHLRVLNAPSALRAELHENRFESPNDGALKLMRRLKASFDPAGIFNPGCFVGGI